MGNENQNQNQNQNVNVVSSMSNNIKLGFGFGCGCLILILVAFVIMPTSCTVLTAGAVVHSVAAQQAEKEKRGKEPEQVKESETTGPAVQQKKSLSNSVMLSKNIDELYAALHEATLKNDEPTIKAGIAASIENNYTTLTEKIAGTPWMDWYKNEIEMDEIVPKPCNLNKICPTDQVNFITTYMDYISSYEQLKKNRGTDVQKTVLSQQCYNTVWPYMQGDIVNWTGIVWGDLDVDKDGVFAKPTIAINKNGTANLVLVVSHLNDLDGNNMMFYKGRDGKYKKTYGSDHVIRLYGFNIPNTMFNELAKINKAGQFVKFSGRFYINPKTKSVWRDTSNILDAPVMYFQFTGLEVQPNQ